MKLSVFLVDDGSTDGTGAEVRRKFSSVHVIQGTGDLYWAGGMALAEEAALGVGPDYLLWLNDDVELDNDALVRLIHTSSGAGNRSIVVGSLRSRQGNVTTYSGSVLRNARRPTSLVLVEPSPHACMEVDTFHGNVVLIPARIHQLVGQIDRRYRHAYGDIDYGLRARRRCVRSLLATSHVGWCESNSTEGTWRDRELDLARRLKELFGIKGIPPRAHWRFCVRHGGILGFVYFFASYAKALMIVLARDRSRARRSRRLW